MFDNEHSLTQADLDAIENRLRNLSLSVLPQLVERDLPRLLNEVRSLHAILFMNQFTTTLQNGVDANEQTTQEDTVQGTDQESTGDPQDGGGDRTSSEDVAVQQDESVPDSSAARQPSRVRSGGTTNKKRNRRRRRKNK